MHAHKSTHIILKEIKALLLNDLHVKDREGSLPVTDKYQVFCKSEESGDDRTGDSIS